MTSLLHRCWLLLAAFVTLLLPQGAAWAQVARPSPLVSVEWLQQQLQSPSRTDLLLIDASMTPQYMAGHIPGAVSADIYAYAAREFMPAEFERRLQGWGVSPGRKVVLYDAGGDFHATRVYWDFYRHGVPAADLLILDGGLARWKAAGGAVTKDPTPPPSPGNFRVTRVSADERVYLEEFLAASGQPAKAALVDALGSTSYHGATKFFDRAGHMPHAISWPTEELFNADKTFKSTDELRRIAGYLGIRPEQTVMTYCGGGVAAAGPWFALKMLLGYPKVQLFRESQLGWLQDSRGLPLWTYAAPSLQRDMHWVNGWTHKMMRLFGVTQHSVIDVRPEAAYQAGHVPYSLSIPAERLRAALHEPARLAELLGPAGVDVQHEAVIVSDGGINPRAALAFVALEHAGQRQIAFMSDSVDEWGLKGLPLTKEPTVVGPRKSPMEPSVAPTAYPVQPRNGVIVRDAAATRGMYPKVYLAAGKAAPAPRSDGAKVVHIPYTELLAADSTPKAAKDLWSLLSKAGVPRYAELIATADDPGEAAVAYVVLKMMGWPDVKVLAH